MAANFLSKLSLFIVISILILTNKSVKGHTFLLYPRPIVDGFEPDGCKGYSCLACPREYENQKKNNSPEKPEGTWKRGDRVLVRWAKNNHLGGFVRISVVPIEKKNDVRTHDLLAFYYGCWVQGRHTCRNGQLCGGDKTNSALQRLITIPSYIPDGVYIFSFVWYGGLDFTASKAQFADYPSCSYIRIQGGEELIESFQPFFDAGPLDGRKDRKGCHTFIDEPYVCTNRPLSKKCSSKKPFFGVPKKFKNGGTPPKIFSSSFSRSPDRSYRTNKDKSVEETMNSGICRNGICCASSCKVCRIKHCAAQEGGRNKCCPTRIARRGRYCKQYKPPCIIRTPVPIPRDSVCNTDKWMVCCKKSCGKCMNDKTCKSRNGGSINCCPSNIIQSRRNCDKQKAPCILPTPQPLGLCQGKVCCPKKCGNCGGDMCSDLPGGKKNCCTEVISRNGRSCRDYIPPCNLP